MLSCVFLFHWANAHLLGLRLQVAVASNIYLALLTRSVDHGSVGHGWGVYRCV